MKNDTPQSDRLTEALFTARQRQEKVQMIKATRAVKVRNRKLKIYTLVVACPVALLALFGSLSSNPKLGSTSVTAPETSISEPVKTPFKTAIQVEEEAAIERIQAKLNGTYVPEVDGWERKEITRQAFSECKNNPAALGC